MVVVCHVSYIDSVLLCNIQYIESDLFSNLTVLPVNAILTYGGRTVINQRVEAAQGSKISIICRGGTNRNWRKGTGSTSTSLPAGVVQAKSSTSAFLIIKSLTPANVGVYTCHVGASTIETVTIGELVHIAKYIF